MSYYDHIKKFVEEDYKDCVILVTCDNEHKFWHNAASQPDIIWDWDNERFFALEANEEIVDQNKHPMMVSMVELAHIQFMTAYPGKLDILKFIDEYYTDEESKNKALDLFKKSAPSMMGPRTLRGNINDPENRK